MANSYEILMKIAGKLDGSLTNSISGASKSLQGISKTASKSSKSISAIEGAAKKTSSGLKSLVKAGAGLAAGFGITMGLKEVIDAASATQDTTKQLETVLKSTGGAAGVTEDQALKLASSLGGVTTFGKNATLASENLLLTFTKIGKDIMPDATETVLNMSQALGQDTKSSAIQLGKALNDPLKGITALQRVGVSFTEQQKEQIKTMVKVGDTAGAQKLILAELGTEFGGSAKAAGQTFSGQMAIAKNAVTGAMGQIGTALIPVIQNLLPKLTDGVRGFANFITDHQKDIASATSAISGFASKIADTAMPVINNLIKVGSKAFSAIGSAAKDVMPIFSKVFDNIGSAAKDIMPAISGILNTLKGVGGSVLGSAFDGLKAAMPSIIGYIKALQSAWEGILPVIASVASFIGVKVLPVFNQIVTFILAKVVPAIYGAFSTWLPKIVKIFQDLWAGVQPILTVFLDVFKIAFPIAKAIVLAAIKGISDVIGGLLDVIDGVINFVTGIFTGNWKKAWEGVKEIFSGVFESLAGIIKIPINAIINLVNTAIDSIDSLKVKIPDGIPLIGGKTIGFNIPHIPQLAGGGVVKRRSGGILANIGEGNYDEAIVPLKPGGGKGNGGAPNINYAPVYNLPPGTTQQDIKDAGSMSQSEFARFMKQYKADELRTAFQ